MAVDTYLDFIEGAAVAPNVHTDWSRLPHFEWASIDRFAEGLAILCSIATIWRSRCPAIAELLFVVGSRDDWSSGSDRFHCSVATTAYSATTGAASTSSTCMCKWADNRQQMEHNEYRSSLERLSSMQ
jgi:hypothetical protein